MTTAAPHECCPAFDPQEWDEKTLIWQDKMFVRDRVRSFLHIPLNFAAVMRRNAAVIEAADAWPQKRLVLSDENSLWGADAYLEVTREIPGACMTTLSGNFLAKVFEGPYRDISKWIKEMQSYVRDSGHAIQQLFFIYTACPKCAKRRGKNYVVLLARV